MIDALVFSRDRAPQLDLLLRSIQQYAPHVYRTVTVLYRATTVEHLAGYVMLEDHHPGVELRQEEAFNLQVWDWLLADRLKSSDAISFLVDDDVFHRVALEPRLLPWSFRGGDFDYPFSLDGNVYERSHVTALLRDLPFGCPTELEWFGHENRHRLPFQTIERPPYACLVGVPANRVATVGGMPTMDDLMLEPGLLVDRYLDGARLELDCPVPPGVTHLPVDGPFPYRWTRTYAPVSFDE